MSYRLFTQISSTQPLLGFTVLVTIEATCGLLGVVPRQPARPPPKQVSALSSASQRT